MHGRIVHLALASILTAANAFALTASHAFAATPLAAPTPTRVLYPGGLDPSFGSGGRARLPPGREAVFSTAVVDPDGRIVVVGNLAPTGSAIVVARYESTGLLDPTFGDGGVVITQPPHFGGRAAAVTLTNGGEIVVAGTQFQSLDVGNRDDILVLRYDTHGVLDASFAGGMVTIDVDTFDAGRAVFVQGGDRIVVVGDTNRSGANGAFVLAALLPDGALDPSFGDSGIARSPAIRNGEVMMAADAVAAPDGRITVAGSETGVPYRIRIVRFDPDGRGSADFAGPPGTAWALGRRADGTIVVRGSPGLLRYDLDGSLDDGFGDHGVLAKVSGTAFAVDAQDRMILGSYLLVRLEPDGSSDPSFTAPADPVTAAYGRILQQPDGKLIALGGGCTPRFTSCFANRNRYEGERTQYCGDADADGTVSVSDGVATLRAAADLSSGCEPFVCDVDGSGTVSITDGVNVLRAAAELPARMDCGIP